MEITDGTATAGQRQWPVDYQTYHMTHWVTDGDSSSKVWAEEKNCFFLYRSTSFSKVQLQLVAHILMTRNIKARGRQ